MRLLNAAERLLAEHGTTGWSQRQLTQQAGHHNNSAVAYHFGSRQGLIDAVWHRRTAQVNARRAQLLGDLDRSGRSEDVPGLVAAHVLPITEEMARCNPSYWARVNETRLRDLPVDFVPAVNQDLGRFTDEVPLDELMALFTRLRAHLARTWPASAGVRVGIYTRFVIGALAAWERDVQTGAQDRSTLPGYSQDLMGMGVALLTYR